MREVFSQPGDENVPVTQQEFCELRISDQSSSWNPGFTVTQWWIRWSEIDRQFMGEDVEIERWPTLQKAQERYEARREALIAKGFVHADIVF